MSASGALPPAWDLGDHRTRLPRTASPSSRPTPFDLMCVSRGCSTRGTSLQFAMLGPRGSEGGVPQVVALGPRAAACSAPHVLRRADPLHGTLHAARAQQ